ncbi:MAG: hypothetical protein IBX64_02220 [Actinobacteria bacterium]|nr:hypothetical protein [Actinomycetota bacterium]
MEEAKSYVQVEVPMPESMVAYLEDLSKRINAGGDSKLDNSAIVRAAIAFLMSSGIDVSGCCNEDDILLAIKRL